MEGQPIVREFSVQEDVNKRGMRKKKRSASLGPADMEDQNFAQYPFGKLLNYVELISQKMILKGACFAFLMDMEE